MTTKLTLSVDEKVIAKAKRYANKRGTSVSRLVEGYLNTLNSSEDDDEDSVLVRSIRGLLKNVSEKDYKDYLEKKYR